MAKEPECDYPISEQDYPWEDPAEKKTEEEKTEKINYNPDAFNIDRFAVSID